MAYNIFLRSGTTPWEISVHTRANDSQVSRFFDASTITGSRRKKNSTGEMKYPITPVNLIYPLVEKDSIISGIFLFFSENIKRSDMVLLHTQ